MSSLVILLSLLTVALCGRNDPSYQTVSLPTFGKNQEQKIVFSRPEDPESYFEDFSSHSRHRRDASAPIPSNITTKINHLNDSHTLLMMRWAGEGSKVLLCLARDINFAVPHVIPPRPSALYISYDYGDTFVNKTDLIRLPDGKPSTVFKFYTHPKLMSLLVLTDPANNVIFVSENSGITMNSYKVDFQPTEIIFNTDNPLIFLARDIVDPLKKLWLTRDAGKKWTMIQESVKAFHWSAHYDVNSDDDVPAKDTGHLYIQRQEPGGTSSLLVSSDFKNVRVLINGIEDFWVKGDYMFATKVTLQNLDLFLSYKGGRFVEAQFMSELKRSRYHVEVSGPQVLVIVGHEPNLANLYVSTSEGFNADGMRFALSLEGIFCFFPNFTWRDNWLDEMTEDSFADFHEVNGLRGIYIASQVIGNPSHVGPANLQSVITFDRGGEWHPLKPPETDDEGQPLHCNLSNNCSLHLSHKFNQLFPEIRTPPILSSKSAPGVILASGTVGQSLSGHPALFLSTDAGVTWKMILKGPHLFNFGDHGNVIVAVKYLKSGETNELMYSTDMGNTFQVHYYSSTKLRSYALMTEPGENSTVFTMFGSGPDKHQWIIVKVDLFNAFERVCTESDYKHWSPGLGSDVRVPCILGKRKTYLKRYPNVRCYSMKNNDLPIKMVPCECDEEDFDCDSLFVRDVNNHQCIRDKNFPGSNPYAVPVNCPPGATYNRTKGYRKIPGDACYNGKQERYLPVTLPCPMGEIKEFLLYARENKIVRVDLGSNTSLELPITGAKNIIALEFHLKNNCVYWSDSQLDVIKRQCLGKNSNGSEIIVSQGIPSVEGMALDWVSNLLYFVDGVARIIDAVRIDISDMRSMRRTIIDSRTLIKPRGIAVHPHAGYLFWTDWSSTAPSVSRANLDGSNIKVLFGKKDVSWPNGLTVDHIAERLYWVDAQGDYIAWSDLDGKKMYKIIQNEDRVSHPFGVAVFKDFVYWDDWKQNAIYMADKDHGSGIQTISRKLVNLKDLKIFAHSMQEGTNACENRTLCEYICVGGPKKQFTCLCPNDLTMVNGTCLCPNNQKPFLNGTCPQENHKCNAGYIPCAQTTCIPETWRCDGEPDCRDGSDEKGCVNKTCDIKMFQCKSDGQCIARRLVCDNDYDCADGSDEVCHAANATCTDSEFKCIVGGQCIPKQLRCDGDNDCRDGSDEQGCEKKVKECKDNEVMCPGTTQCILKSWKCDGTKDCADGWDEQNCKNMTCDPDYYTCHDGMCMFKAWRCDGEPDCHDGSDEWNCTTAPVTTPSPPGSCKSWMLTCDNGQCVPLWWRCDGVSDCTDRSDEIDCPQPEDDDDSFIVPEQPTPGSCHDYYFSCSSGTCIPDAWVCDNFSDCEHGEDEEYCQGQIACTSEQFKCYVDGSCISRKKVCDGVRNCPDGSDEISCDHGRSPGATQVICNPGLLPCNDECIEAAKYCDGHRDCIDGRDEANCNGTASRIFQVTEITDDPDMNNATSIKVYYKGSASGDTVLEFLPSITPFQKDDWKNHTAWITSGEFVFGQLAPFSRYNITVYARKKGSTFVYPPAHYHVARTTESVPDAPRNLTAHLVNATCIKVTWAPPEKTNGLIILYKVSMNPPDPPLTEVLRPGATSWCFSSDFQANTTYTFRVTARNGVATSASAVSTLWVGQVLTGPTKFRAVGIAENSVQVTWDPLPNVRTYEVRAEAPALRLMIPAKNVTGTEATVDGLAPGETYDFFVKAIGRDYVGLESMLTRQTKGTRLPEVKNVTVVPSSNVVSWSPVTDKRSQEWEYGLYFQEGRSYTLKKKTNKTTITWDEPPYCKEYVVAVGLVGPLGVGPISAPSTKMLFTGTDVRAAPVKLRLEESSSKFISPGMTVSWEASCKPVVGNVSYVITVTELTRNRTSTVTLSERSDATLKHVFKVHSGGVYNVTVSTDADKALVAGPRTYMAPPIPRPEQVKVEPVKEGFKIVWQPNIPQDILASGYDYEILVSEGPTLNETTAQRLEAAGSPFTVSNVKEEVQYTFAVRVKATDGYLSPLSQYHSSQIPRGTWSEAYSAGTSKGVYYVAIPSVVLVLGLGAALFYYVVRHRRLQQNFELFANSHYDTRSGAATFGGTEELEEDDSPVIRGFSDDEPMVLA